MLEAEQVAQAYARWIANGEPDFQAMMSPDLHDHVSGATGPQTWDTVWGWIETKLWRAQGGTPRLGHAR